MAEFEHDIFLSYASADHVWAKRLHADLTAKGARVFFDRERLKGGLEWKQQLLDALVGSRHLLVLWSPHAAESRWVTHERAYFAAKINPSGESPSTDRRRFTVVLRGEDVVDSDIQMFDLRSLRYPDGEPKGPEWTRTVTRIADAALVQEGTVSIPLLLMTMTAEQAGAIDPAKQRLGGPTLAQLLAGVDIATADLGAHYGASRADWRPFGSDSSVHDTLMGLQLDLNRELDEAGVARRLRWDYVDADFWSSTDGAASVTKRLAQGPAVIVVDPVAFYEDAVFEYYSAFAPDILRNERAAVLVLSPFPMPAANVALRTALRSLALQIHRHFYNPLALIRSPHARCGVNVGDDAELAGWLASAVGPQFAAPATGGQEYLGHPAR